MGAVAPKKTAGRGFSLGTWQNKPGRVESMTDKKYRVRSKPPVEQEGEGALAASAGLAVASGAGDSGALLSDGQLSAGVEAKGSQPLVGIEGVPSQQPSKKPIPTVDWKNLPKKTQLEVKDVLRVESKHADVEDSGNVKAGTEPPKVKKVIKKIIKKRVPKAGRQGKKKELLEKAAQEDEAKEAGAADAAAEIKQDEDDKKGEEPEPIPKPEELPSGREGLMRDVRALSFGSWWVDEEYKHATIRYIIFLGSFVFVALLSTFASAMTNLKWALNFGYFAMLGAVSVPIFVLLLLIWLAAVTYSSWMRRAPDERRVYFSYRYVSDLVDPQTDVRSYGDKQIIGKFTENAGLMQFRHQRYRETTRFGVRTREDIDDSLLSVSASLFGHIVKASYCPSMSDGQTWDRLVAAAKSGTHINLGSEHTRIIHDTVLFARDFVRYYKLESHSDFPLGQPALGGSSMDTGMARSHSRKFNSAMSEHELAFATFLILLGGGLSKFHSALMYLTGPGHTETQIMYLPSLLVCVSALLAPHQPLIVICVACLGVSFVVTYKNMFDRSTMEKNSKLPSGSNPPNTQNIEKISSGSSLAPWIFLVILCLFVTHASSVSSRTNVIDLSNIQGPSLRVSTSSNSEWLLSLLDWSTNFINNLSLSNISQWWIEPLTWLNTWVPHWDVSTWPPIIPHLNHTSQLVYSKIANFNSTDTLRELTVLLMNVSDYIPEWSAVLIDVNTGMSKLLSKLKECPEKCQQALATVSPTSWWSNFSLSGLDFPTLNVSLKETTVSWLSHATNYTLNLTQTYWPNTTELARSVWNITLPWICSESDTSCLVLQLNSTYTNISIQLDFAQWYSDQRKESSSQILSRRSQILVGSLENISLPVCRACAHSSEVNPYHYFRNHEECRFCKKWLSPWLGLLWDFKLGMITKTGLNEIESSILEHAQMISKQNNIVSMLLWDRE